LLRTCHFRFGQLRASKASPANPGVIRNHTLGNVTDMEDGGRSLMFSDWRLASRGSCMLALALQVRSAARSGRDSDSAVA